MVQGAAGGDEVTALVVLPDSIEGADVTAVLRSYHRLLPVVQVVGALWPCFDGVRGLPGMRCPALRRGRPPILEDKQVRTTALGMLRVHLGSRRHSGA